MLLYINYYNNNSITLILILNLITTDSMEINLQLLYSTYKYVASTAHVEFITCQNLF